MTLKDLMSRDVRVVKLGDRLDAAARVLWDRDCGVVPVVDGNGAVVGVLTDRDVCMAAFTQGRTLAEIPVAVAMARKVHTARPDDDLATALAAMAAQQVHRLPVVDARGVCIGVVSSSDLVRHAEANEHLLFRTKQGERVRIPLRLRLEELVEAARARRTPPPHPRRAPGAAASV